MVVQVQLLEFTAELFDFLLIPFEMLLQAAVTMVPVPDLVLLIPFEMLLQAAVTMVPVPDLGRTITL
jgi:hypothetical protein